jgi:hypothetical protein
VRKLLSLQRAGHIVPKEGTRTSLRYPVKINLVENKRSVEDIKVDVRFDGWEEERTNYAWYPQACLLISSTET